MVFNVSIPDKIASSIMVVEGESDANQQYLKQKMVIKISSDIGKIQKEIEILNQIAMLP